MTTVSSSQAPPPDPSVDSTDEPAARNEHPAYLMGPEVYFPQVRLIEQTPSRWVFVPEGNRDTLGWLLILLGVFLGSFIVMNALSSWHSNRYFVDLILPFGFSVVLMARGLFRLKANRTRVYFDLESKTCRLVVPGVLDSNPDGKEGKVLARIEDLRAVQLLHIEDSLCCRKCFELNLVFCDDTRVFVIGAPLAEPILDDAIRLAAFLGKPIEKTSTQMGPHQRFLFSGRPPRG